MLISIHEVKTVIKLFPAFLPKSPKITFISTTEVVFLQVNKDYGQMPFNLRCFEDSKKARLGVMECVSHKLVSPYPVLWEREGELVAQFKYTVLVMPNGPVKITGLPFDIAAYQSEVKLEDSEEVQVI